MTDKEKVKAITAELTELLLDGPMIPGSLTQQWNVCGKKGCRCRDAKNPRRHGPYGQLSFSLGGKSSSMFIKSTDLEKAGECTSRYRKFKQLFSQLVAAYVAVVREQGFEDEPAAGGN